MCVCVFPDVIPININFWLYFASFSAAVEPSGTEVLVTWAMLIKSVEWPVSSKPQGEENTRPSPPAEYSVSRVTSALFSGALQGIIGG